MDVGIDGERTKTDKIHVGFMVTRIKDKMAKLWGKEIFNKKILPCANTEELNIPS